jgi:hypothetical protein
MKSRVSLKAGYYRSPDGQRNFQVMSDGALYEIVECVNARTGQGNLKGHRFRLVRIKGNIELAEYWPETGPQMPQPQTAALSIEQALRAARAGG